MTADTDTAQDVAAVEEPIIAAALRTDGTGWARLLASPQWWRWAARSPQWPELAEEIARAAERSVRPDLCRVVGATTKRPCKFNTASDPCPHHGEGNQDNCCGAITKKGKPCQWNLAVNGECPNHPESWQRIQKAREDQENAERLAREEAARLREQRWQKTQAEAREVTCGYCRAEPGTYCHKPDGTELPDTHTPRRKLRIHSAAAAAAPCSSCGAETGQLCRTSSAKDALDAHAARLRAVPTNQDNSDTPGTVYAPRTPLEP